MKRPGPLPAARPSRPPIVENDRPLRAREEPDNVIPLERGDETTPADAPTRDETRAPERGVGWRELWRASTARRKALRAHPPRKP